MDDGALHKEIIGAELESESESAYVWKGGDTSSWADQVADLRAYSPSTRRPSIEAVVQALAADLSPDTPRFKAAMQTYTTEMAAFIFGAKVDPDPGFDPTWLLVRRAFIEARATFEGSTVFDDAGAYGLDKTIAGVAYYHTARDAYDRAEADAVHFQVMDYAHLADKTDILQADDMIDGDQIARAVSADLRRLNTKVTAIAPPQGVEFATPSPIAALEGELDRLQAIELAAYEANCTDEEGDAHSNAGGVIARQILAFPAKSIDDFRIKAKTVSWCYGGDPIKLDGRMEDERPSGTSILFAEQILDELLSFKPPKRAPAAGRHLWDYRRERLEATRTELSAFNGDDDDAPMAPFTAAEEAVHLSLVPDLRAVQEKLRLLIDRERWTTESFDDALLRRLEMDDMDYRAIGIAFQDIELLLRGAGADVALHPRSFNWRIESLGGKVTAEQFELDGGEGVELFSILALLKEEDRATLHAAAWIESYTNAGGNLVAWDKGIFIGCPVPTSDELQKLLDLVDPKTKAGTKLRTETGALARSQMKERGTVIIAVEEAA